MNELMTNNTNEKTVTVVHAFSGKELVIVSNPDNINTYFSMGYIVKASNKLDRLSETIHITSAYPRISKLVNGKLVTVLK